jgi:hypothetical protein
LVSFPESLQHFVAQHTVSAVQNSAVSLKLLTYLTLEASQFLFYIINILLNSWWDIPRRLCLPILDLSVLCLSILLLWLCLLLQLQYMLQNLRIYTIGLKQSFWVILIALVFKG